MRSESEPAMPHDPEPKSAPAAKTPVGTTSARRWANSGRIAKSSTRECLAVPAVAATSTGVPSRVPSSGTSKKVLKSPL